MGGINVSLSHNITNIGTPNTVSVFYFHDVPKYVTGRMYLVCRSVNVVMLTDFYVFPVFNHVSGETTIK